MMIHKEITDYIFTWQIVAMSLMGTTNYSIHIYRQLYTTRVVIVECILFHERFFQ